MVDPVSTVHVKIEILDKNEGFLTEITGQAIDGSISVDKERDVRRQFSLTLLNTDGRFTWSPGGLIWLDKRIKLYVGFETSKGIEYAPLGVFLIESPTAVSRADGTREVRLQGGDKWKLLDGAPLGKFQLTENIAANVRVDQTIRFLLGKVGITNAMITESASVVVPYTLTYQLGEPIGKAIKELADLVVYTTYFDVNGVFVFKPRMVDMTTQPSVKTYAKNRAKTVYAGGEKTLDESEMYNVVIAIGGSAQTFTVSSRKSNDDPNSPISTVNIGQRLFLYNNGAPDAIIKTQADADNRAEWELLKHSKIAERQRISLLPDYTIDVEDVITIQDDWTATDSKYEILRFDIALRPDSTMSLEAWQVRKVGA